MARAPPRAAVRRFKLVVGYDGTDFHGWQAQPGLRTVQGVLEEGLRSVLDGESVKIEGAGRTDRGVHARGQVVSFESATGLPARALGPLLNPVLPRDLRIRAAHEAGADFHARRSAAARRYAYRLLDREDVLLERFAWHPRRPLDPDRLERATRPLAGEHDFSAFRATGSTPVAPKCRVLRAGFSREGCGVRFDVVADHFLYHMVRTLVGTALAVAAEPDPALAMADIIASRDRRRAGPTVPAQGLCLEQVYYGADGDDP